MPYSREFVRFGRELEPIKASQVQFKILSKEERSNTSEDRKIHCFLRPNGEIQRRPGEIRCKDKPVLLASYGATNRYCCDSEGCRKAAARAIADEINQAVDRELRKT